MTFRHSSNCSLFTLETILPRPGSEPRSIRDKSESRQVDSLDKGAVYLLMYREPGSNLAPKKLFILKIMICVLCLRDYP